jgi:glycosyltransferase involved in cell wall biosynthesis
VKIAIVTLTTTARRTGVAEYLINLINELQVVDKKNQYYIFTGKDNRHMFSLFNANFIEVPLSLTHDPGFIMRPIFHFWQIFILPRWCRKMKVDLIHLPNTLYVSGSFPTLSTIHDVVELKTKKYSFVRTFFRKLMINSAIRNSRKIVTVSQSSATDLIHLGAKDVTPIHLGFTNPFTTIDTSNDGSILKKYNLSGIAYVLFVGTLLKHKNIPTLIEAFELAKEKNPALKLVLIGAPDNDFNNIEQIIRTRNIANDVFLLNYVTHEEKLVLLRKATVFCLISSYEGFGIPILEAQAAGVPVIANNISSLPEIGGEGVFLVNPDNLKEETAQGIIQLTNDNGLRDKLIRNGSENIARFSWSTCAQKTLAVYSEF